MTLWGCSLKKLKIPLVCDYCRNVSQIETYYLGSHCLPGGVSLILLWVNCRNASQTETHFCKELFPLLIFLLMDFVATAFAVWYDEARQAT